MSTVHGMPWWTIMKSKNAKKRQKTVLQARKAFLSFGYHTSIIDTRLFFFGGTHPLRLTSHTLFLCGYCPSTMFVITQPYSFLPCPFP